MIKRIVIFNLILSLAAINNCYAKTITTKKHELTQLKHTISALKSNITMNVQQQTNVQQQLAENETSLGNLLIEEKTVNQKIATQKAILSELEVEKTKYIQQLASQKDNLKKQMQAMYMLGQQSYMKVLLNADDPTKINRIFMYYHYLQTARIEAIDELNNTLTKIQQNQQDIQLQTQKLTQIQLTKQQEELKLKHLFSKHRSLLITIKQKIQTQQQKLNTLIAQQKQLESLITHLQASSSMNTGALPSTGPWRKNLSWPTRGKVENLFGTSIANSELKWDGILIAAPKGQKVFAIASGRVVFAEWLQGYGLLMIIDHGGGYMSLYGRNNVLYKKVGDLVNGGELITDVGDSGGYDYSSLYFAIRYNGKPVDPKTWCKA